VLAGNGAMNGPALNRIYNIIVSHAHFFG
jgi:hypothetical protein